MEAESEKTTKTADTDNIGPEVFFDGSCPLCRAEINLYQSSGAEARFCDITRDKDLPEGKSHQDMMARFHVREDDGRLLSGAAAFAALWRATPGWRWLGRIAGVPPFVWLAEGLYRVFLIFRPALQGLVRAFSPKS